MQVGHQTNEDKNIKNEYIYKYVYILLVAYIIIQILKHFKNIFCHVNLHISLHYVHITSAYSTSQVYSFW